MRVYKNIAIILIGVPLIISCGQKSLTPIDDVKAAGNAYNIFKNLKEGVSSFNSEKKSLPPIEYIKWIEDKDNGLRVSKEIENYIFTVQYKPHEYVVLKTLKDKNITYEKLEKEESEISDLQYYTIQIATKSAEQQDVLKTEIGDPEEYYKRIEYFSFHVQNDLKLVENKDTLYCILHHFERTYGITPYINIVLAFKHHEDHIKPETEIVSYENKTFVYDDHILGVGTIKLTIKGEDLIKIPELKIY